MNVARVMTYMSRKIKKSLRKHASKPNNDDTRFEIFNEVSQDFERKLEDIAWDFGINLFTLGTLNNKHITSCSAFVVMEELSKPIWFDVRIEADSTDTDAAYERAMSIV